MMNKPILPTKKRAQKHKKNTLHTSIVHLRVPLQPASAPAACQTPPSPPPADGPDAALTSHHYTCPPAPPPPLGSWHKSDPETGRSEPGLPAVSAPLPETPKTQHRPPEWHEPAARPSERSEGERSGGAWPQMRWRVWACLVLHVAPAALRRRRPSGTPGAGQESTSTIVHASVKEG